MINWRYIGGLLLIISIIWFTMILCFAVVYSLIPPIDQLLSGGFGRIAVNIIQLLVAGAILTMWLYAWNMLAKFYFSRNLNTSEPRVSRLDKKKRK